jgi:SEL1 protein
MRGKSIKIIDLLQHSAELGNTDALYTLAKISLVRAFPFLLHVFPSDFDGRVHQFPPNLYISSDPSLAYHSFLNHAILTGNASSRAFLGFFHATGYKGVVPVDQAKALLYYTFAGLNGEKEAEMALGYRYWTGIGTVEDCVRALEWYQSASQKGTAPPIFF